MLLKFLAQGNEIRAGHRVVLIKAHQYADPVGRVRLLCPNSRRPRRRPAEQRDELAATDHSITSSARPRSVIGKVRPSVFAVLRLMKSSTFVACWTGRSAGLAPARMRPVCLPP